MIRKKCVLAAIWILLVIDNALTYDDSLPPHAEAIIRGESVSPDSFLALAVRHQVQIVKNGMDFCGGSIIDDWHILTAAHCVIPAQNPGYVIIGMNKLENTTDTDMWTVEIVYKPRTSNGSCDVHFPVEDIAVLKLNRKLGLDKNPLIGKVQLPEPLHSSIYHTYENDTGIIAGYGITYMDIKMHGSFQFATKLSDVYPKTLQMARVVVLPQDECVKAWKKEMTIESCQLCARMRGQGFRGVCMGDSGNGLIYNNRIIGVLSYSNKLCYEGSSVSIGQPAVYTRVSSFVPFIKGILENNILSNITCSFGGSRNNSNANDQTIVKKSVLFLTVMTMLIAIFIH